jgi:hypothetical protein
MKRRNLLILRRLSGGFALILAGTIRRGASKRKRDLRGPADPFEPDVMPD